jgi:hypothetical protein
MSWELQVQMGFILLNSSFDTSFSLMFLIFFSFGLSSSSSTSAILDSSHSLLCVFVLDFLYELVNKGHFDF